MRHWLQLSDWLPTLEATLALDEESVRRVGDDTVGGPAVSRQLRLIRILMRDLLIGVCQLLAVVSIVIILRKYLSYYLFLFKFILGELLAQPWPCPYRIKAGECAYKSSG